MEDVSKNEGRTVLFVSHNMPSIQRLCSSVIHLQGGSVAFEGQVNEGIDHYLNETNARFENNTSLISYVGDLPRDRGIGKIIKEVWIENSEGQVTNQLKMGESFTVKMRFEAEEAINEPIFVFFFENQLGVRISTYSNFIGGEDLGKNLTFGVVSLRIDKPNLNQGIYFLSSAIIAQKTYGELDFLDSVFKIQIYPRDIYGSGQIPREKQGLIYLDGFMEISNYF